MKIRTVNLPKRIFFLILLFLEASTNISCNTSNTYYISSDGNDGNDGKSINSPWNTIKDIEPGSTYLLKRNQEFHFVIKKVNNSLNQKVIIGAYGTGANPVISLYKNIKPAAWQMHLNNIWKVDLTDQKNITGFLDISNTNVGFIKVNDSIKGNKLANLNLLKKTWDFYSDRQYLYVYSEVPLSSLTDKISITTRENIINLSDNMEISDLSLKGAGAHGVSGKDCKNIILNHLEVSEIGGSYLQGTERYGNGIQFWHTASDCLIKNCNVHDVYDVAYTIQSTEPESSFERITFDDNIANNNEQSFEFWVKTPESYFKKCSFINNHCTNAGFGWSHSVRPDKNVAVHLLCYFNNKDMSGININNNTFINAKSGFVYLPAGTRISTIFNSDNNTISLNEGVPISAKDVKYTLNNRGSFFANFGIEQHSTFKVLK